MPEPKPLRITSVANLRLKRAIKLRKPRERRAAGVLLAEGRREVKRAFAAGLVCRELWRCAELLGTPLAFDHQAEAYVDASSEVFRKLAWHDKPEGVLGVFDAPSWTLDTLPPPPENSLYLVAVGTEKPGNLGAMVRTAAAAGCDAVLAVCPAVDVFNPAAIRNSTGAVFALPVVVVTEADEAIAWLVRHGVSILAAVAPEQGGDSCFDATWQAPAAVAIGPEHDGLSAAWREAAAARVTVPMAISTNRHGDVSDPATTGIASEQVMVDSLNASNAAAILLYEAVRRRIGSSAKMP